MSHCCRHAFTGRCSPICIPCTGQKRPRVGWQSPQSMLSRGTALAELAQLAARQSSQQLRSAHTGTDVVLRQVWSTVLAMALPRVCSVKGAMPSVLAPVTGCGAAGRSWAACHSQPRLCTQPPGDRKQHPVQAVAGGRCASRASTGYVFWKTHLEAAQCRCLTSLHR